MRYTAILLLSLLVGCEREPPMTAAQIGAAVAECNDLNLRAIETWNGNRDVVKITCVPKRGPLGIRVGKLQPKD